MWTRFMDMHSGGGTKEGSYDKILIEAPMEEAKVIFYNRFGHDPERVTCTCCGDDYSISEDESLEHITAYDRNCAHVYFYEDDGSEVEGVTRFGSGLEWDRTLRKHTKDGRPVVGRYVERADLSMMEYGRSRSDCEAQYQSIEEYIMDENVLLIPASEIKPVERKGSVRKSGYVWID